MNKKVKAPTVDKTFRKYWDLFIEDVENRENFKKGHLEQLAILCKLYKDFYVLSNQIDEEGFTYSTESSRYGSQVKVNPACTLRDKVLMEIRQFSKLLGLVLEKDNDKGVTEGDSWD